MKNKKCLKKKNKKLNNYMINYYKVQKYLKNKQYNIVQININKTLKIKDYLIIQNYWRQMNKVNLMRKLYKIYFLEYNMQIKKNNKYQKENIKR